MQEVLDLAARIAPSSSSVLITGETGVGKEWLARRIHRLSPRAEQPFVAVNCAALPAELVESELFGHEKGAFTGAAQRRRGQFELASGGTLLLDEIGDMPLPSQAKLLRALEEGAIRRVGGERPIPVDVRLLAATNRQPEEAIAGGRLRADLFYRLGVLALEIPPLRERPRDVLLLAREQLDRLRFRLHRPQVEGFSEAAEGALLRYPWPGNVRELINVLERAVLLGRGTQVALEDLPPAVRAGGAGRRGPSLRSETGRDSWSKLLEEPLRRAGRRVLADFERAYLDRLLEETGGRLRDVSRRAGIDERTLYGKMKRYGLAKEDYRS